MTYITNYSSKLGDILLASDGDNLTGLWFKNQKYYLNKITDELLENPNLEIFHKTKKWLDKYFQGIKVTPNQLKLKPNGSPFQQEVWKILCNIPYGKTITYGEIAKEIAQNKEKNPCPLKLLVVLSVIILFLLLSPAIVLSVPIVA